MRTLRRLRRGSIAARVASLERFKKDVVLVSGTSYQELYDLAVFQRYDDAEEWQDIPISVADRLLLREFINLLGGLERTLATDWDTHGESHAG